MIPTLLLLTAGYLALTPAPQEARWLRGLR